MGRGWERTRLKCGTSRRRSPFAKSGVFWGRFKNVTRDALSVQNKYDLVP
jgi:hypothetical protein